MVCTANNIVFVYSWQFENLRFIIVLGLVFELQLFVYAVMTKETGLGLVMGDYENYTDDYCDP